MCFVGCVSSWHTYRKQQTCFHSDRHTNSKWFARLQCSTLFSRSMRELYEQKDVKPPESCHLRSVAKPPPFAPRKHSRTTHKLILPVSVPFCFILYHTLAESYCHSRWSRRKDPKTRRFSKPHGLSGMRTKSTDILQNWAMNNNANDAWLFGVTCGFRAWTLLWGIWN